MRANRRGFTMPELMIVFSIMGIMTMIAIPRIRNFRAGSNMRSAKAQVASSIATARAAAIQKGHEARFILHGSRLTVEVNADTASTIGSIASTGNLIILSNVPIDERFAVTVAPVTAADSMVRFDARGFGSTGSGARARYVLRGSGVVDTVCVSGIGLIMKNGCNI